MDYLAPVASAASLEYRVLAMNSADDLSTGVSAVATVDLGAPPVAPLPLEMVLRVLPGEANTVTLQTTVGYTYSLWRSTDLQAWTGPVASVVGETLSTIGLGCPDPDLLCGNTLFFHWSLD